MSFVVDDVKNYQAEVCRYQPKPNADFEKNTSCRTYLRKPFVLFHTPTPSEVDDVFVGMTS